MDKKYYRTPIDDRFEVIVAEALKLERRRAAILGIVIAAAAFALGFICGMRWTPV